MQETSLYLVPTPIGNLEDITLRAIRMLQEADVILAEDTRNTGILLKHLQIQKPLQSHHAFNEHQTTARWVERMQQGEKVALVSDAGTPAISDPGFLLLRAAIEADLKVETLPGPCALIVALVNSGLPCDRFCFEGFLPVKKGRQTRLQELGLETRTMVFYESPHRLLKTLQQMADLWGGERRACVSRELTKMFEENARGSLLELIAHFTEKGVKGEIVLVVEGKAPEKADKKKKRYNDEDDDDRDEA